MLYLINDNNQPPGPKSDINPTPGKTGIDRFNELPWGTHMCLLYKIKQDLLEVLIPFMQAGLSNNEYCIWITSEALSGHQAKFALKKAVPDFNSYYDKGQIVFINNKDWYQQKGRLRLEEAQSGCFARLNKAVARGYEGLRIASINTWLETKYWKSFQEYEEQFNHIIQDHRIIAMCSYAMDKCDASQMMDVVCNHQSTLIKCSGEIKLIESCESRKPVSNSAGNELLLPSNRYTLDILAQEKNKSLHVLNEMLKAEMRRHTRTEQALHLSDRKYRTLFNSIDEGFSLFEISHYNNKDQIDYLCLDVNPAFETLICTRGENLIGRKLGEVLPDIFSKLMNALNQVASSKEPLYIEEYIDQLDRIIAVSIFYLEVGQIAVLITDITDRKRAEESLRLSEEKFSKAFHSSPSMMTITTLDGWKHIDVNEMFCRLTGYTREEVIGRSLNTLGLWCQKEDIKTVTDMIFQGLAVQNFEVPFCTKTGDKHVGLMSSEIINIDGQPCLLNSITDISQRIQIQEEMARLDRLNLIGQMAASISHETRNPMTTVRGFLQMLKNKPEYLEDVEYFEIMIEELDRADSIISEFLSLAPNIKLQLEPGNINHIIDNLSILIQADALANDKHIAIQLEDIPDQLLDRKEIRQLLLNLVRNAMEAVAPNQTITIRTYMEDNDIVLEVKDEGCGMPAEIMNKLGTPFFTTKEHGTGLGLSVCYSIAERHNAVINIDTSPSGTTFYVRFKQ